MDFLGENKKHVIYFNHPTNLCVYVKSLLKIENKIPIISSTLAYQNETLDIQPRNGRVVTENAQPNIYSLQFDNIAFILPDHINLRTESLITNRIIFDDLQVLELKHKPKIRKSRPFLCAIGEREIESGGYLNLYGGFYYADNVIGIYNTDSIIDLNGNLGEQVAIIPITNSTADGLQTYHIRLQIHGTEGRKTVSLFDNTINLKFNGDCDFVIVRKKPTSPLFIGNKIENSDDNNNSNNISSTNTSNSPTTTTTTTTTTTNNGGSSNRLTSSISKIFSALSLTSSINNSDIKQTPNSNIERYIYINPLCNDTISKSILKATEIDVHSLFVNNKAEFIGEPTPFIVALQENQIDVIKFYIQKLYEIKDQDVISSIINSRDKVTSLNLLDLSLIYLSPETFQCVDLNLISNYFDFKPKSTIETSSPFENILCTMIQYGSFQISNYLIINCIWFKKYIKENKQSVIQILKNQIGKLKEDIKQLYELVLNPQSTNNSNIQRNPASLATSNKSSLKNEKEVVEDGLYGENIQKESPSIEIIGIKFSPNFESKDPTLFNLNFEKQRLDYKINIQKELLSMKNLIKTLIV